MSSLHLAAKILSNDHFGVPMLAEAAKAGYSKRRDRGCSKRVCICVPKTFLFVLQKIKIKIAGSCDGQALVPIFQILLTEPSWSDAATSKSVERRIGEVCGWFRLKVAQSWHGVVQ